MSNVTQWLSSDEQRLWREFLTFKRDLQIRIDAQLRDHGLSESDYTVLVVVSESEGGTVRVKEIADATGWESSRLAHQLRRMEKRDLIFRMPCQEDARGTLVSLTEPGMMLLKEAAPGHVQRVRDSFINSLNAGEQGQLHTLLCTLTSAMPPEPTPPPKRARKQAAQQPAVTPQPAPLHDSEAQAASVAAGPLPGGAADSPQNDGSSGGDVQRIDLTAHGDSHHVVTSP